MFSTNVMDFTKRCTCVDSTSNVDDYPSLKVLLPDDYNYRICDFHFDSEQINWFHTRFRVNCFTKGEIKEWLTKFERISFTTFRVLSCQERESNLIVYKVSLKCLHNTKPEYGNYKKPHAKHTNCRATMRLTVKVPEKTKNYKSVDVHLRSMPGLIILHHLHNHNIYDTETLKFRDPSPAVRQKLIGLFQAGHTPTRALAIHKDDLLNEFKDDFVSKCGDRAICPDIHWVYRLYYKVFKNHNDTAIEEGVIQDLESLIAQFNNECGNQCAVLEKLQDTSYIIVVMSPLMKRVLKNISTSEEVLFVDTSANDERFSRRVFLLTIYSCSGGLPVGIIFSSSKSKFVISSAFELYKKLIEPDMFCKRGPKGPMCIFIDDCATLRTAITGAFPEACVMLCTFQLLQETWKYMWKETSVVEVQDRQTLFLFVKKMLCSAEEKDIDATKDEVLSLLADIYPKYSKYVNQLYKRRNEWAFCCQKTLSLSVQDAFNLREAAVRVLKEKILLHTKTYNLFQLFQFLLNDLNSLYMKKLTDTASGLPSLYPEKENIDVEKQKFLKCNRINEECFEVTSTVPQQKWLVNTMVWHCSCPIGISGGLCRHQECVAMHCTEDEMLMNVPCMEEMRRHLENVANDNFQNKQDDLDESSNGSEMLLCPKEGISSDMSLSPKEGISSDMLLSPKEGISSDMLLCPKEGISSDMLLCTKGDTGSNIIFGPVEDDCTNMVFYSQEEMGSNINFCLKAENDGDHETAPVEETLPQVPIASGEQLDPTESEEHVFKNLDDMCRMLKEKAATNKELMDALHHMTVNYQNLKSDADLVSACNTFGNYPEMALSTRELPGQDKSVVQETAVAQNVPSCEGTVISESEIVPEAPSSPELQYADPNSATFVALPAQKGIQLEPDQIVLYIV